MKNNINIGEINFTNNNEYSHDYNEYVSTPKMSKREVELFYSKIKCYQTNFGNDPYNNNSYGQFEFEGEKYRINPPKYINGDSEWYAYYKYEFGKQINLDEKIKLKISIEKIVYA